MATLPENLWLKAPNSNRSSAEDSPLSSPTLSSAPSLPHRVSSQIGFGSFSGFDSPYLGAGRSLSLGNNQYALSPDPQAWGADLSPDFKEPDDELHEPDPDEKRRNIERDGHIISCRGLTDLGGLVFVCTSIVALFVGYPMVTYFTHSSLSTLGGYNLGRTNGTGQVPSMAGPSIIDPETPHSAYTKPAWNSLGTTLELVFSDEFNTPGRSFYPGDDPYWEAEDLHYWATDNLEWFDPAAVTTAAGSLVITLQAKQMHGLGYQSGLLSSWNKLCFTGGYIETRVMLPGVANVAGLWPAIWTMGNLGRAGYGATLDGMWPYTYDACDVGTVANQSINGKPYAATINGDKHKGGALSYLPGQRLSRCTCDGESHPGPNHADGTFVGRSAPEIDVFEAQNTGDPPRGQVSQSAQWGPFDAGYLWQNTSANLVVANRTISELNIFLGSVTQQATSVVTYTNQECYEYDKGCFSIYGFEYEPGFDNAYITWISENKVSWTLNVAGMDANPAAEISARAVPQEPMYIILNLAMSHNFGAVDLDHLPFPVHMRVDYIRIYQPSGQRNVGCDPQDFPTKAYINQYIEAYTNPNLTSWTGDYGKEWPKNRFLGQC